MLHPLQILRDRIENSEIKQSGLFMTEADISLLKNFVPEILSLIPALNKLGIIPGTTLNILDYDDTMQPRYYQLQLGLLQDNRGLEGNRIIDEVIGRERFLEIYYKKSSLVKRIFQILEMQDTFHQARIVTAGEKSWQTAKVITSGVYDRKKGIEIVPDARLKILSILKEILSLGYIPSKIIIYDDKPEHFKHIAKALSKFLGGVEIVVNQVVLSQQEVIKKQIDSIHQTIYSPGVLK